MPQTEGGGVSTGGNKKPVPKPPEEEVQSGGKGVVRPPVRYDTPTQPAPRIHDPAIADRILVSSQRGSEIFRDSVTETDLYNMPDSTAYTAFVKNDLVATAAKNEVYAFFSSIYGTENTSQLIAADLLPEPQRSRTFAALAELSQNTNALAAARGMSVAQQGLDPQEILTSILNGSRSVEDLTVPERALVAPMADEMIANLEDLPSQGIAGDVQRAIAIGVSGSTALSLTEQDVELLKKIPRIREELGGLGGTTLETPFLNQVGIDQIRELGEGVIVLDLDDAKADPARAFAVRLWLEQNHPELEIQYGREGVVGSLLDKLGAPLDYITAPFGAGLRQLSEFGEGVGQTPENRKRLVETADTIERMIQEGDREGYMALRETLLPVYNLAGGVDPEKGGSWETEAQRAVVQFRDQGTEEVGWNDFVTQMDENTRPRIIGFGFGESYTKATDTLPGDSWYAPAYLSSSLLAALVADPLNWAPGLIGGAKAARGIPKLSRAKYDKLLVDSAEELRLASATGLLDDAGKPIYALSQEQALARARGAVRGVVTEDALYPIVGRGWVKNSVYRALAKSPEELMTTRRFTRAGRRLHRLKETVGEGEFFTAMNRWFGENWRRGGGLEVARSLSQATSADDMGATLMRSVLGLDNSSLPIDDLVAELDDINRTLNTEKLLVTPSRSADDILALETRRLHLEEVISGRDYARPLEQIPSAKQLRQIERQAGASYGRFSDTLELSLMDKVGYAKREAVRELMKPLRVFERMYRPTGASEVIIMPHMLTRSQAVRAPGGIIAVNQAEDSLVHLANIGRLFGIKDRRINQILAPWRNLIDNPDSAAGYDVLKQTWESLVDESPRLPSFGKTELKQMWKGSASERSPSWLTINDLDGSHQAPVVYRTDPVTGVRIGKPAIEADQLTTWRTPSLPDLQEYLGLVKSHMKVWKKAGGVRGAAATGYGLATTAWSYVNSFWRTTTLGFRLFGALPARIFNEQALRIAAYDFASTYWHPMEWFLSTKTGSALDSAGFNALFRDHPGAALGVMVDNMQQHPRFFRRTRNIVEPSDGEVYWRAYAERIDRMNASPSVYQWHLNSLGDTDATLGAMRNGRYSDAGKDWLRTYDDYGMDAGEAVTNTQREIDQLLGTGEGRQLIEVAMRRGSVEIDGTVYKTGTKQFADKLQELSESGRWTPGAKYFNASAGDYLPLDRTHMTAFRDGLFRTFYSAPDLALSRSPMYRQLASREYRNLISRGYSATRARELARARAARGTADMMFTIGAKTSGEYFLRNLNPFFPAYRELATTWLKRLPMRVGEGHWALGSAALVRRADIWYSFFKEMGVLQEQADGGVTVPIPGIGNLMAALTGREVGFNARTPIESLAGILPVPTHLFDRDEEGNLLPVSDRVKGIFPTLGGPATFTLGMVNQLSGDKLDMLEDFLTLYGADTSLGPFAIDRFAEAFGITLPWMSNTTTETHQRLRTWASIDGQRLSWAGMIKEFGRPPDPNTPEGQKWAEEWINRGEQYAMWSYLVRGVSAMTLPFSLQVEDEGKAEVAEMWSFLNGLPRDESGAFRSAYIRSFLADNPELEPYMVGKNLDTRPADNPDETRDEYFDAIERGDIKTRSAADQAVFTLGSNVMFDIQARINAFYAAAESPVDFIMNFEAKTAIDKYQALRDDYLAFHNQDDLPRNRIEGQSTSFASMWEEWEAYQSARDGDTTPRLSFEQRRILAIADLEDDIFKYFGPGESSEDYFAIKDRIYEKLNYQPRSDVGMAQQWYFGDVQESFYDRRNELFDKLDKLTLRPGAGDETGWQKAQVYQQIRELSAEFDHTFVHPRHPEWGEFPSPEAYSFIKLQQTDPEAAERQVAEWALLPANYLTNFQREQVGYAIPEGKEDAANKLAGFITENEVEFDKAVERFNISTSSTVYEINRDRYDRAYVKEAQRLGLSDYWRYANSPEAVRLGNALNLSERTGTWNLALQRAKELSGRIETTEYVGSEGGEPGPFYSATGDSAVALEARERMNDTITTWRRNDTEFDQIIGNFQVWLSGDDRPLTQQDLVDKLFFGKTLITVR